MCTNTTNVSYSVQRQCESPSPANRPPVRVYSILSPLRKRKRRELSRHSSSDEVDADDACVSQVGFRPNHCSHSGSISSHSTSSSSRSSSSPSPRSSLPSPRSSSSSSPSPRTSSWPSSSFSSSTSLSPLCASTPMKPRKRRRIETDED